jgi:NADH-quinone oxidoreductase subunit L
MMKMGGLAKRMPVTFWTFLIGGLALSGFPIITAGFWSKDEILAHAWAHNPTVFWALAAGALLTAFYTMRQICLTFLGEPRSHHAEHAHETPWVMTGPLVMLALFALFFGFVGVPEDFPVIGEVGKALFHGNWFHHFVGATLGEAPEALPFNPIPVSISVGAALLGLLVGWLVYGRQPLAEGQTDPLVHWLGPVHTVLRNKYYIDEFYGLVIIRPTLWLAKAAYEWIDRGLIDGILHGLARLGELWGILNRWVHRYIIDGGMVDGSAKLVSAIGREFRQALQTGQVQHYLISVLFFLCTFALLYLLYLGVTP